MDVADYRKRLRYAFQLLPEIENRRSSICLWRFPLLEELNHSWTFSELSNARVGFIRIATWNRFEFFEAPESSRIQICDHQLTEDQIVSAYVTLDNVQIVGSQQGGIYDGARYGLDVFDHSGELTKVDSWIHSNTLLRILSLLPQEIVGLMGVDDLPLDMETTS